MRQEVAVEVDPLVLRPSNAVDQRGASLFALCCFVATVLKKFFFTAMCDAIVHNHIKKIEENDIFEWTYSANLKLR